MTRENGCSDLSGVVAPVVDRNKCEGKAECVQLCPYDVFAIDSISDSHRTQLSIIGKIKAWAHGGRQAFVVNPHACQACNLCVAACPESALELRPVAS